MDPITCSGIRYIKLGKGNIWADEALERGEVPLGHSAISHEQGLRGDKAEITQTYVGMGRKPGPAKSFAREVVDFYSLPADCLWITFARGRLWWAFARPDVTMVEPRDPQRQGARVRQTIGGWKDTNIFGVPLSIDTLSSKLTKVSAFQQTLCRLDLVAAEYLLRKINGTEEPLAIRAREIRDQVIESSTLR